jgi:hypothetical protein
MGFIGDAFGSIFGKGGSTPPPVPAMPVQDNTEVYAMMGMMQEMMGGMMEGMAGQMEMMAGQAAAQQESILAQMEANMNMPMPEVYRSPEIDFTEAQDRLNAKAKADFHLDQMRRKSVTDTILTSPLLEDEEPQLGGSVLSGE